MKLNSLNSLYLSIFTLKFNAVRGNDIVVNSTAELNWSSTIFMIPVALPYNHFWDVCRTKSSYYCLVSFEVQTGLSNPAFELRMGNNLNPLGEISNRQKRLKKFAVEECDSAFRAAFQLHNYYVLREDCCQGQCIYYFSYGFKEALITPTEYFAKITDYSEENKHLNYLLSYYDCECEVNIITKIGFGSGSLKHEQQRSDMHEEPQGKPYQLKVGQGWSPKIPYDNPGYFLTFRWFKHYVMCPDQPWICREPNQSSNTNWWTRFFNFTA